MSYLIGADVGTTGLKAVLVESTGTIKAVAERRYELHHPRPGWAENDPNDWFDALAAAVRDLLERSRVRPSKISAIGIDGQRDNSVLLNESGEVLAPSIHWSDQRDPEGNGRLFESVGRSRILDISGVPPTSGLVMPNLVWVQRNQGYVWSQVRHVVQPKDYLAFRLTGEIATDDSSPSRSLLNDWRRDTWSLEICGQAGIPVGILPPIRYRPWESRARLSAEAASTLGLREGVTLAAGGGDDQAAMLGSGAINDGDVSVGTGSSMCWRIVTSEPMPDTTGQLCIARHAVPDLHVYEMIAVGSGTSLPWFRGSLAGGRKSVSYSDLIAEATAVPPGADGLLFFPYLAGATSPRRSDQASGVFYGIRAGHERGHFVRAIMEGSAFLYPDFAEMAVHHGASLGPLTMVDGEARSVRWNQIKADVLRHPIRTPQVLEAAALGSAIHAGVAVGEFESVADGAKALVQSGDLFEPDDRSADEYAALRTRWKRVGSHLFGAFDGEGSTPNTDEALLG